MKIDWRLLGILFLNMIVNGPISIIAPFYPPEAQRRDISPDIVGYVFAALPLGGCIFSLIFGKYMRFWGRKRLLLIGITLLVIGFIMFGLIDFTLNKGIFLSISLIARIFQGIGLSASSSVLFAYLPQLYNDDSLQQKIGYMEASTGIGMMIAPIFGSLLYYALGYQSLFYVISALLCVLTPVLIRTLPADQPISKDQNQPLSLWKVLSKRKVFLTYGFSAFTMGGFSFYEPGFAGHLATFGMDVLGIGLIFSLGTFSYTIFMLIVGMHSEKYARSTLMGIGGVFYVISFLLLGPEGMIGIPRELWLICFGMIIMGFAATLTILPIMPEFIFLCEEIYPNEKLAVGDLSAGMFDSSYLVGGVFGPVLGGYLTNYCGFGHASSLYALIFGGYLVIYMVFGGWLEDVVTKKKEKKEKLLEISLN